jgi:signal transduction histidine kinase
VGAGDRPNLGLSIAATAVVAVAFQPVRSRVQHLANRLVYGKRATPYEVLSEFSSRVAGVYATEELLGRMARLLADGTGARSATVWLRVGPEMRPAATWPEGTSPEQADRRVEVSHRGEVLGALSVAKRPGESLSSVESKLLSDLASQAGVVLRNVRLTEELLARLEELAASRKRLVAAQDEERRRIERNLHDGAQQQLVALKVRLSLVERISSEEKVKAMLADLAAEADGALQTLRDLARGIYPPLLEQRGLAEALSAQAAKATVPVGVEAEGLGRYPREVEAAVYFCCLEALNNAGKYAGASQVVVRLRHRGGELSFEVQDDGAGFDASAPRGSGLTNMADRMAAIGGEIEVISAPGSGTTVRGRVPVAEPAVMEPVG